MLKINNAALELDPLSPSIMDTIYVVNKLNSFYHSNISNADLHTEDIELFSVTICEFYHTVAFDDNTLWNSEYDEREEVDDEGNKEEFSAYILAEARKYVESLSNSLNVICDNS